MKRVATLVVSFAALLLAVGDAAAQTCRRLSEAGKNYIVCDVDIRRADLRLFWKDGEGKAYNAFAPVADDLARSGQTLAFAMNGGMFHPGYAPVGLYIEAGREQMAADTKSGEGNFYLLPNGVFYWDRRYAGILETKRFIKSGLHPDYATQSGPLLVMGGILHPKIDPTGPSEKIRNGVGVRDGHIAVFAISEEPVSFYRFATLFRDALGCPDALYLDGSISSLYAPGLGRADRLPPLGPIIGVVERAGH